MLDWQMRRPGEGFQSNAVAGHVLHGVLGWDRLAPESQGLYLGPTRPMFRKAAKPEAEARLWSVSGMAAGIQPWWHHLGARQEDRRQLRTAERLSQWHAAHEGFLVDRRPVAPVGVAWSETNIDWYGRGESAVRTALPFAGAVEALGLDRLPWRAVHADHVARDAGELDVLVLPNLAAISDAQAAAVRAFVAGGGGLVATGESSRYDEEGRARADFALADLFGAHASGGHRGSEQGRPRRPGRAGRSHVPARRGRTAPRRAADARRHGPRGVRRPRGGRARRRERPRAPDVRARVAAVAARERLDARAAQRLRRPPAARAPRRRPRRLPARRPRPLHGARPRPRSRAAARRLVRWAARRPMPLEVEGAGLLDCHLYRQPQRLVLHVVNLTNPAAYRLFATGLHPVGPLRVRVACPPDLVPRRVLRLVAGGETPCRSAGGWLQFTLDSVLDHEVIALEP